MKALIAIFALSAAVAHAETITLGYDDCGLIKQCLNVPNDAGVGIDLYGSPSSAKLIVYLDGKSYTVPAGQGVGTASDGSTILFAGVFTTTTKRVNSGRLHRTNTYWHFQGGSIER